MRLLGVLAAVAWTVSAGATQFQEATNSASQESGLTKRDKEGFTEPKYFYESRHNVHYDRRYFRKQLSETDQRDAIRVLIQTYLSTFRELGVQTWLMHGSLLGWWWGKKIMPWDLDADVQVTEADMYYLAAYHNMTTFFYQYSAIPSGRSFLLEINPYFKHREQDDYLNVIDGRWIDMSTGLFIDITAARYNVDHPQGEGILYDKNGHEYRDTYLYPLLETTFEGAPTKIPYGYRKMLASEYGEKALTNTEYHGHLFNEKEMQWIPTRFKGMFADEEEAEQEWD